MKIKIEINENASEYAEITSTNNVGMEVTKTITVNDLVLALKGSEYATNEMPIIMDSNIKAFSGSECNFVVYKEIASQEWMLTHKKKPFAITLPKLLFRVTNAGDITIFVIKGKHTYKFDFPNMYANNSVCFGTFAKRVIKYSEVDFYINEVMSIPYSHEWTKSVVDGKYIINKKHRIGTIEEVIKKYK